MRKFLKRFPFNKVFVTLFVTLYTFLPSTQALGTVIDDYSYDGPMVMDISEDILEEGISDPEEIANPEILEGDIPKSTYEGGVYTVSNVELEEYVYPDDENVRVRFTSITEEGNLVISKVELTEEEKEKLNTSDDYGWDITSTMSNGSFTYDLTLPNTLGDGVEVKYTEDGEIYNSIDNKLIVNEDVIEIKGLEHFSIYIVSSILPVKPSPAPVQVETAVSCDITVPTDIESIQEAIDKSKDSGERLTICVKDGVYKSENLNINHPVRLLALLDDPQTKEAVIIGKKTSEPTIHIGETNNVEINGLTIVESNSEKGGILVEKSSECLFINNRFLNNGLGMYLINSEKNRIEKNIFQNNQKQITIEPLNDERILKTILSQNEFDGSIIVRSQTRRIIPTIFGTIQAAVDSASNDDILDIYYGTYNENVEIDKPLTLIGVQEKPPVIHGGFTVDTAGTVNVNHLEFRVPTNDPVDSIHIDNVDKLYVENSNFNGSGLFVSGSVRGIMSDDLDATVTVQNSNFKNCYYTAIQGKYAQLDVVDTTISNCKSGINFQGGKNLVAKNTDISVIAQGNDNDTYAVRFASSSAGSGQDMILDGGKYSVDKNGHTADSDTYHSAIVVRSGASGDLKVNNLSLNGDVVNLSETQLDARYNWWGDLSGPYNEDTNPNGKVNSVSSNVDYEPWYKDANLTYLSSDLPSTPTGLTAKFQYDNQDLLNGSTINKTAKPNGNNLVLLWQSNPIDLVTGYRILGTFPDGTTKLSYQGPNTNAWLKTYNGFGAHGNGRYSYQVIAVNKNGVSAPSAPFVIYYDTHGPTAKLISAPANNSYVNGDFDVKGIADDNVALRSVFFDVRTQDGGTWKSGCKSGTTALTYSNENKHADILCTIDTGNLVNGTKYMLRIHAGDNAGYGNVNPEAIRYFTMDTVEPTVSFEGLRHYDYRYPSVPVDTLNINTSDNTPIVLISASDLLSGMNSVTVNEQTAEYDGGTYWIVELPALEDGINTLKIVGTDKAGNTKTVSQDIFIDTNPPTAIYTHYNNEITIDETANPITYVKGINQLSFTAQYADTIPSSGLYQDSFVIFQAQDDGSFRFSANDKQAYCSWRKSPNLIEGLTGNTYDLTEKISFTKCIESLPDGEYYMAHQVYDNTTRWNIPIINQYRDVLGLHFVVDKTKPTVKITNVNITDKKLSFTVSGTDNLSGARTVATNIYNESNTGSAVIEIGRLAHDITPETLNVSHNATDIDISELESGTYTIRASIRDYSENIKYATYQIDVDNTPPTINWNTPQDLDLLSGNISLDVTCDGTLGDCDYINFWWWSDEQTIQDAEANKQNHKIDTNGTSFDWTLDSLNPRLSDESTGSELNGVYTLRAAGKDLAGNYHHEEIEVTVDNTLPVIASHSDMTLTEGESFPTDTVTLTDSYGELDQVCITIKDASGTLGTSTEYCVSIDASNLSINNEFSLADEVRKAIENWQGSSFTTINLSVLPEGVYQISYYATDKAENESDVQTFIVTIQNNTPTITINPTDTEVTAGDDPIVLSTTVTNGNPTFTYLWSGDCTGTDAQTIFDPTTEGSYTCTVTVTDADGDTSTDSVDITVGAVAGATTENRSIDGISDGTDSTTPSSKQPPTGTYNSPLGTGGYLYSQTDLLDTEEQQTPEEETITEDTTAVKGEEDNNEQPTNQEETTEGEQTKWWIYPLVILPILAIFLILWKRRKEDNEPQF